MRHCPEDADTDGAKAVLMAGGVEKMRTAIIGGGIAGLAAAYELEKARAAGGGGRTTRCLKRASSWAAPWHPKP